MISDLRLIRADDLRIALADDPYIANGCHVDRYPMGIDPAQEEIVTSENVVVNAVVLLDRAAVDHNRGIRGEQDRPIDKKVFFVEYNGSFAQRPFRIGHATLNGLAVTVRLVDIIPYVKK
jgi:hypothetical protein